MGVSVDFVRVAVHVDPHVVIGASTAHITVENTVSLALRATATRIFPYPDIEPVFFFLDVYVVEPVRAVDLPELNVVSDIGFRLPLVCDSRGRPFGYLDHLVIRQTIY
jgi:hypothetical protein